MRHFYYGKTGVLLLALAAGGASFAQSGWQIQRNPGGAVAPASEVSQADKERVCVGYVSPAATVWQDDGLGGLTEDTYCGFAVKITKEMLQKYAGGKIVAYDIGWSGTNETVSIDCFLREDLQGDDVFTSKGTLFFGWTENKLDKSYTIPDSPKDIYIGYYATVKANTYVVPTSGSVGTPNSCFMWKEGENKPDGTEIWYDFTNQYGAIYLSAVVEGKDGQFNNMVEFNAVRCQSILLVGEPSRAQYTLTNKGTNDVQSVEITINQSGESVSQTCELPNPLQPAIGQRFELPFSINQSGTATVSITKVNGSGNKIQGEKQLHLLGVPNEVAERYQRRTLVEFCESETSAYIPTYYTEYFLPGLEEFKDNLSLVAHHLGDDYEYGNQDDTRMMLDFVNNDSMRVYIPAMMTDRSYLLGNLAADGSGPAHSVVFPEYAPTVYGLALGIPTFAALSVDAAYDSDKRTGVITVKGEIAAGVMPEGEPLFLTVYVLEDGVQTDTQLFWDEAEAEEYGGQFIHDNVIRLRPTPMYGAQLPSNSGEFLQQFDFQLNERWDPKQMRIVAFINRGIDNGNFERNVINTAEKALTDGISIAHVETDGNIIVTSENGRIEVVGTFDSFVVYDLHGRMLDNENLHSGVYVVKVDCGGESIVQKVLVD